MGMGIVDEVGGDEVVGEVWVESVSYSEVAIDVSLEMALIPYRSFRFLC
jgi:hypothetical protein